MRRDQLQRLPWVLGQQQPARLGSAVRRLRVRATHLHADVHISAPVRLGPGFTLDIPQPARFHTGPACDFRRGFVCELAPGAQVQIGAGTVFTSQALVQITSSLVIGVRCTFGQAVQIADGNHRFRDPQRHLLDQGYDLRPLTIGDGATVMSKCTVLASVGERAVIGAGSVVTRDVPAYCLAVGAPARVVEYFGPPDRRPDGLPLAQRRRE